MRYLVVFVLLGVIFAGCAPKQVVDEVPRAIYADDVRVEVNDREMTVSWRKHGEGAIGGYNIYVSKHSLVSSAGPLFDSSLAEPINTTPFPGDTDPDDGIEHFVARSLENGVVYYVSVRVVFPDGLMSKFSNEVLAVCGPRGEIELGIRYQGGEDGYSFNGNRYVSADDVENDLYFFSKEGVDYLCSPKRLNGFLKDNHLMILPYRHDNYDKVAAQLSGSGIEAINEQVEIVPGDWVLINLPDGHNAIVNVLGFNGEGKERRVRLFFAVCTIRGGLVF